MGSRLKEKIGQMLVIGFRGTSPQDEEVKLIRQQIEAGELGGIILFRHNIEGREQVAELVSYLKSGATNDYPLFVMVDQEGGKVQRLHSKNGFQDFPSAKEVSSFENSEDVAQVYREMGEMLSSVGINFNLTPCIDLECSPPCPAIGALERSYGESADTVTTLAKSVILEMRASGVLTSAKHFPGHGSAQADTHKGMVEVSGQWNENELKPYEILIGEGELDSILAAHVVHNEVDEGVPASLSKRWLQILRDELSFDGVVVTDDLHMGAIQQQYSNEEILLRAVQAGVDLMIFSNNPAAAQGVDGFLPKPLLGKELVDLAQTLVQKGELSIEAIDRSFERIVELKSRL